MSYISELAEAIARHGIRNTFGIPGSGASLELIDALAGQGVTFHRTAFEGAAPLMAGAVAKVSGRAGLAVSIKGPGLANMVPGLAGCGFESLPVVAVAEAYPPDAPDVAAHKRMDHSRLVGAVVKATAHASCGRDQFAALAGLAESEEPGPVLLNLPPAPVSDGALPSEANDDMALDGGDVAAHIVRAERPVVIAGTLAARKGWSESINRLRIPVFTTAAAKGVVDETQPHAAGVYTGVGLDLSPEVGLLEKADLLVCLGLTPKEVLKAVPFATRTVAVLGAHFHFAAETFRYIAITGTDSGEDILAALAEKAWGTEETAAAIGALEKELASRPFGPCHVYRQLEQHFAGGCRVVLDTGDFCTIGEHIVRCRTPDQYLSSGNGRYMGLGLPQAIGACIEDPSMPVVAVVGDGGLPPFVAELRRAVEMKLPLLVVLMSDGGYGSVRRRAIADNMIQEPLLMADPSWIGIMEAMGLDCCRAEDETGVADALAGGIVANGPGFIEVAFDPEDYQRMTEGVR